MYSFFGFFDSEDDRDAQILQQAIDNIKNVDNLTAIETINIINENDLIIKPLHAMEPHEYQKHRAPGDPEDMHSLIHTVVGLFMHPNCIYVDTNQDIKEVERTLVHEIQHFRNKCLSMTIVEDEMSATESEDRYIGCYITRRYIRDLRDRINKLCGK